MTLHWQDLAAIGLVFLAVAYLARLALGLVIGRRGGVGCGSGCGACPSHSLPSTRNDLRGAPLVSIGPPRVRVGQDARSSP